MSLQPFPGNSRRPNRNFYACPLNPRLGNSEKAPMSPFACLLHRVKSLFDFSPVDDIPPRADVISPPILVLQVVGVLPNVEPQHREFPFHNRAVLVGGRVDIKLAALGDEPSPSRAKAAHGGGGELLFEGVEASKGAVDGR